MPSDRSNIKVIACLSPLSNEDKNKGIQTVVKCDNAKVVLSSGGKEQTFVVDETFGDDSNKEAVFAKCSQKLVNDVLDGLNGTLITIGGATSGKSYLIDDVGGEPGLANLCIERLYREVRDSAGKKEFLITASHVQVQESKLLDLLNPHNRDITVTRHPRFGTIVKGLSEFVVQSNAELTTLYNQSCQAKESLKKNAQRPSTVFTLSVFQKVAGQKMGVKSRLQIVELGGIDNSDMKTYKNLSAFLHAVRTLGDGKKRTEIPWDDSILLRLLENSIGGNCVTHVYLTLLPGEKTYEETSAVLAYSGLFRKIKNNAQVNVDQTDYILAELREEIAKMRSKVLAKTPTSEDIKKFETLVADMQYVKQESWTEKIKATSRNEEERPLHLANAGLAETLREQESVTTKSIDERLKTLNKERKKLSKEYKEQRTKVDTIKIDLEKKIEEYSKAAEGGRLSDSEVKTRLSMVHDLKESLQTETVVLRELKAKSRELEDQLDKEKEVAGNHGLHLLETIEVRRKTAEDARQRQVTDHTDILAEEAERAHLDRDQARAEANLHAAQGWQPSKEQALEQSLRLADLEAERKVAALKIQFLEEEKATVDKSLQTLYNSYKEEIGKLQAANFEVFREYRETFERQKHEIERRFRGLLEDSIKDAIFLSSRNNELMLENKDLRKENAELKDAVTKAEAQSKKK